MSTKYFQPSDILGLNAALALSGNNVWDVQTDSKTKQSDRAAAPKSNGDEKCWHPHNTRENHTLTYECEQESGYLAVPNVGAVLNGYHVDSVKVSWSNASWPTLDITCHKHTDGTGSHVDGAMNQFKADVRLPAGFGCPVMLDDFTIPDAAVQVSLDESKGDAIASVTFELGCTHTDDTGSVGNWKSGENRDGVETITFNFLGQPDVDALAVNENAWHLGSGTASDTNQAGNTAAITLTRHVDRVTA